MSDSQVPTGGLPEAYDDESVVGIKTDVFRNLNTGGYSVRSREKSNYGRVASREQFVVVKDAEFVVQEGGRQRVLEEGVKNVHAVVRGVVGSLDDWSERDVEASVPVTYDPYEYDEFVHASTERGIACAELVCLHPNGVAAVNVEYTG